LEPLCQSIASLFCEKVESMSRLHDAARSETVAAPTRLATPPGDPPKVLARSLHQKETGTTGLIVADILNSFHALLAKGVQDTAEAHNDVAFLFNSDEQPDKEVRDLDTLQSHLPQHPLIIPMSATRRSLLGAQGRWHGARSDSQGARRVVASHSDQP